MADQVMTTATEMDALIPEVWSSAFFPTLLAALPMNESVARSYEGDIKKLGDKVNISNVPEFDAAEAILEGQKVDADSVTVGSQTLTVDQEVVKDFIITDRAMVQSIDAMNELRNAAFYSILKKMQSIILTATVPSASAPDHQIAYDSGSTLALADLLEGKELLDTQNVPEMGRCVLMDTPQANDLLNVANFTSKDYVAASPMSSGALPAQILGMQPKVSTEASAVTYLFHPDYLNLAVQKELDVRMYDLGGEGKRALRVNSTILFGVKQTSDVRVVEIS